MPVPSIYSCVCTKCCHFVFCTPSFASLSNDFRLYVLISKIWRFFGDSGRPDSIIPSTLPETWQSNLTRDCDAPVACTSTPIARKSETTTDSSFWPRRNSRNMRPLNFSCAAHLNASQRYLSHGWPSKLQPMCGRGGSAWFSWCLSISALALFCGGGSAVIYATN